MALLININDLLGKHKIESNRIEFKKGWNPGSIYHSICAFANDFDDLGGGYIIVGVETEKETGIVIRPVEGVPIDTIDGSSGISSGISSGMSVKNQEIKQKTAVKILNIIKNNPKITAAQIAMELDISTRGVEKNVRKLREAGIITRVGSPTNGGYWKILIPSDE